MPFSRQGQQRPKDLEQELLQNLIGGSLKQADLEVASTPLAGPQAEVEQVAGIFDFLSGLNPFDKASDALEASEEQRQQQKKNRNRGTKTNALGSDARLRLLQERLMMEEAARRRGGEGQLAPPPNLQQPGPTGDPGLRPPAFRDRQASLEMLLPLLQQLS